MITSQDTYSLPGLIYHGLPLKYLSTNETFKGSTGESTVESSPALAKRLDWIPDGNVKHLHNSGIFGARILVWPVIKIGATCEIQMLMVSFTAQSGL